MKPPTTPLWRSATMGDGLSKPDEICKTAQSGVVGGFMAPWLYQPRSPRPSDTVIIFDWDDTLLCSSAINMQDWTVPQLAALELAVESVLKASMNLGETLII